MTVLSYDAEQPQKLHSFCCGWNRILVGIVVVLVAFEGRFLLLKEDDLSILFSNMVGTLELSKKTVNNNDKRTTTNNNYSNVTIFYHVFINPERMNASFRIVEEQLAMWNYSSLANAPLYYGIIVGNTTIPTLLPCPNGSTCRKLYQRTEGWEVDTLQKLFEYCQNFTSHTVVYMHSKGSYHDNDNNRRLRILLTRSVFSHQCHMGLKSGKCNVCSARFSPMPHWHTPGNMWTAKCSYVANLMAPLEFEPVLRKIVMEYTQRTKARWPTEPGVGIGRFAAEHYIHTHPRVQPCGMDTWGRIPNLLAEQLT